MIHYLSKKALISFLIMTVLFITSAKSALAEDSQSVLFVPLIGITSVPKPLFLEKAGSVTYNYAVKNFVRESPLTDVQVVDDSCGSVKFVTGDDNRDSKLDFNETWRYTCTIELTKTTSSAATAIGHANNLTASHNAYATVVVGSKIAPPLVSIINITKVANPLSLPASGGKITFTYKVNNPGSVALSDVAVSDNKCKALSSRLGDTNGNNLLDTNEVWIYTCTTTLEETTTNTVTVTATANGFVATDNATITVNVAKPAESLSVASPDFPAAGINPNEKFMIWGVLGAVLIILIIVFFIVKKKQLGKRS